MHSYESLRENHGQYVSQTIDSPIMVVDFWEISDVFIGLFVILVFGVIFYYWSLMIVCLILTLGFLPIIKRKNPRGILLHWPYRVFGMKLPGLVNPGMDKKYSD